MATRYGFNIKVWVWQELVKLYIRIIPTTQSNANWMQFDWKGENRKWFLNLND